LTMVSEPMLLMEVVAEAAPGWVCFSPEQAERLKARITARVRRKARNRFIETRL
jgi:hypothetical protein